MDRIHGYGEDTLSESGYTRIIWSGTGVYIRTTHRQPVVDAVHELRELLPKAAATYVTHLDGDNPHVMDVFARNAEIRLSQLDGRDEWVAFWLVQRLCEGGWEPFQVRGSDQYHLRMK